MWSDRCNGAVASGVPSRQPRCQTPLRKCDERSTRGDLDEAVSGQGLDSLAVEIAQRTLGLGHEAQCLRTALAEGAFEAGLLAQGLVATASRWTRRRERTDAAARNARKADRCAEIHQRLARRRRKPVAGAFLDSAHVRVHRQDFPAERKVLDCRRGVGPNAGKLPQIFGPALSSDLLRGAMQIQAAAVVAEPLPGPDDLRRTSGRQCYHRRPPLQPGEVTRDHALDLRLLQHHLRDKDRVRISRPPPGEVASAFREPGKQGGLHRPGL
jgi:hypothetical protein